MGLLSILFLATVSIVLVFGGRDVVTLSGVCGLVVAYLVMARFEVTKFRRDENGRVFRYTVLRYTVLGWFCEVVLKLPVSPHG